ncbi:Do family serine endopeptidase [Rhabdaerophilum calidifontis]|uniref:Do family serine endopeptidase n=1 Tax=Rhabdaerophilum calidifontis TaxID=2604328 RepID=UPI00123B2B17|nr:Do family serine endopeptidase [Rhabdaerophilum calidifontis]
MQAYDKAARRVYRGLIRPLAITLFLAGPAAAQGLDWLRRGEPAARPPASRGEIALSFAPVVKAAAPAVVNVYASSRSPRARNPFAGDPFFERFFGAQPERQRQSVGSGVIVAKDGIVVTNHHVIEGMTEIKVALADRREFEAEIKLRDPKTDLAVLQIKARESFAFLELGDSDRVEVGDLVLAIGNPFGVGQTVTQGIVSALARTQVGISDYQFFIQTDAAINPGNSGGALVDMAGRVVGINTAIFSRSGGSHGIGFAIPANMVRSVVESARLGAVVRRPWFGASLQPVTGELAETLALTRPAGALVAGVVPGGPAEQAGIRRLDVIVAVDGVAVEDPDAFGFRFATKPIGGQAIVSLLRGGKAQDVTVRLAAPPETPPRNAVTIAGDSPFTGATVWNLSPAVKEELSLAQAEGGIVIAAIEEGSPAAQVGFQKGDVILAVNGQRIDDTAAMARATRARAYVWRVTLNRNGQTINSVLGG